MEHQSIPDDSAHRPAVPCEMHTPGPRRTLPTTRGPGAVPKPCSAWHAERSQLHPEAPPQRPLWGCWAHRTLWPLLPQPPVPSPNSHRLEGREENCSAGGGGVTRRPIFPTPQPSLAAVTGGRGCPTCRAGRGGGVNPTSMAQNDTHVALIILTSQMWGGGGGLLVEKTFSGQNLCSCANIRSYTKQRARHGTPFLQHPPSFGGRPCHLPPPPSFRGRPCHTPPPPQSNFQIAKGPPPPELQRTAGQGVGTRWQV